MNILNELNNNYSFTDEKNSLAFEQGKGGLPVVCIKNKQANATISLQGAQLLSWVPTDEDDVIWLSNDAIFSPSIPVRGGIPICWPWFGAHATYNDYPAHGFARNLQWDIKETSLMSDGATEIIFVLDTSTIESKYQKLWPWPTRVECRFSVSNTLTIEIKTINNSGQEITISQALHSYFDIGDINETKIYGLENKQYLDKTDGFNCKTQKGAVTIGGEVDRVYIQTDDDILIDNNKRKISIKKQGSQSTIVWNPWRHLSEKMTDMENEAYLSMLCVESANAAEDVVRLAPAESHSLLVTYTLV